jgi:outer membrane protein assembly factor BamB
MPNSGVVAFEASTGATVWENVGEKIWQGRPKLGWPGEAPVNWASEDKQASYATPVVRTIHGQRHGLCFTRQGLVSLDPQTGRVNFSFWFRARVPQSVNAMNPVVVEDLILISAAYYRVGSVLLRVQPDGRSVTEIWRSTVLEQHWDTPIHRDGYLYAFSGRNEPEARFRCVELKTGKLAWDRDESWRRSGSSAPPVYGRGSAILADGKLIVLGEGGLLGLFRLNPREPEEICRWQVPQLQYPCWTAPVLAHGQLYLRSEDQLVCLELAR